MIEHIVLFKVKPDTPTTAVTAMVDGLRSLRGAVPGVVDLSVGANTSDRSKGFTHGLVVRFRDAQALAAYLPHAEHQRVVQQLIRPIVDDVLVVDYEI